MLDETESQISERLRRAFYREELSSDAAARIRRHLHAVRVRRRRIWPVLAVSAVTVPLMATAPSLSRLIVAAIGGPLGNPGLYGAVGKAAWQPLNLVVSGGGVTLRCQAYYSDGWQTSLLCGMTGTGPTKGLAVATLRLQDSAGNRVPAASYQAGNWPYNSTGIYTFFGSVTTGPAEIGFTVSGSHTFREASFALEKTTQQSVRRVNNAGAATVGGVTVTIARVVAGPAGTQVRWAASVPGSPLLIEDGIGWPSLTAPGGWSPTGMSTGGGAVDGVATADWTDPLPGNGATVSLQSFQADLFVPVDPNGTTVTPMAPFGKGTVTVSSLSATRGVAFRVSWTGADVSPNAFVLAESGNGDWWMPETCSVPGGRTVPCSQALPSSGTLDLSFPEWPAGATPEALRVRSGVSVSGPWKVNVTLPPMASTGSSVTTPSAS